MARQAIGIDLGTANSRVCALKGRELEIIRNDHGELSTPSCVAFTESGVLIGDNAKEKRMMNQRNKVFSVKRVLGIPYGDPLQTKCKEFWPFEILNISGKTKVKVTTNRTDYLLFPEEISAMILKEMKRTAEIDLDEKVSGVVIAVPAYFNDSQRQATIDAGAIAGLEVLGVINEPTAAAIAFSNKAEMKPKHHVMIIDFGAGGLDVSIIIIKETKFEVIASSGSPQLNGEHLDNVLMTYYVDEIKKTHEVDISTNIRAMSRLRSACEEAKRYLSSGTKINIIVDGLVDGNDFVSSLTSDLFDELCGPFLRGTIRHIDNVLNDAKINKDDIDDIRLLGGCGNIRMIRSLVCGHLGKTPQVITSNEDVAYGAAIHAAKLTRQWQWYSLRDVTHFPLTIEIPDAQVRVNLMQKNEKIPTCIEHTFTTMYDKQQELKFKIFEGGDEDLERKKLLGKCSLTGIPPAPQGEPEIIVTFEINLNGILHVLNATERNTGKKIGINFEKDCKTNEDLEKLAANVDKLFDKVTAEKLQNVAKDNLERYAYSVMQAVSHCEDTLSEEENKYITSVSQEMLKWLSENQLATREDFERQLDYIRDQCTPAVAKIHKAGKLLPEEWNTLGFSTNTSNAKADENVRVDDEPLDHRFLAVAVPNFNAA